MNDRTADDAKSLPDGAGASGLSRREFVGTAAVAGSVAAVGLPGDASAQGRARAGVPARTISARLNVNGTDRAVALEPRATLLDTLRERLGLTGAKVGCNHGQCGACTVIVDGRRVLSCLTLAVTAQGRAIQTIEGLANGETLHPVQQAFIDNDALQCGYCTSGQIMSAVALAREPVGRTDADVAEAMSGNLCRCGAYAGIIAAVQATRARAQG